MSIYVNNLILFIIINLKTFILFDITNLYYLYYINLFWRTRFKSNIYIIKFYIANYMSSNVLLSFSYFIINSYYYYSKIFITMTTNIDTSF